MTENDFNSMAEKRDNRLAMFFSLMFIGALLSLIMATTASATVFKSDHFDSRPDWDGCSDPPSGWSTYFWNSNYCNKVQISGDWDDAHGSNGKSVRITWPSSILELGMTTYNVSGASHVWTGFWWRHDAGYSMGADNQDKWIYFNEVSGVRNMLSHKNNTLCFFDGSSYDLCVQTGNSPDTHPNTGSSSWINDTAWHYYTILADPANDDIRVWRDGTELKWNGDNLNAGWAGNKFDSGYMTWGYQSRSGWGGHVSYFDDIIAATTKAEVDEFLGASGTTPTPSPSNTPPIANAGNGLTLSDINGDGFEQIQLDGTNSNDSDGSIVLYEWKEGATTLTNTANAAVNVPVGNHVFTLTVTDNEGAQTSDTVAVSVLAGTSGGGGNGGDPSGEVLLQESFDDSATASRGWYDAGAASPVIVTDAQRGKVLEYSYSSGASTPSTGAMRQLFTDTDEITLSYYVKYQSDWSWVSGDSGPHEFYLLTNLDHSWKGPAESHGTTYIEMHQGWQRLGFQDALNIDQSKIGSNLANLTEQRGVFGCNGTSDQYPDGICWGDTGAKINGKLWDVDMAPIQNDQWHQVKVHLKMNSITNGVGNADGVMEYWIDGQQKMSLNNILIRTGANPNMKWNQLMIAPYFHNGTPKAQKFWIDDLVISNTVGASTPPPEPTPEPTPLAAPTGLRILQ
ncbi:MAG TPA: hypothetical protein VJ974_00170 [Geopsychrobacteraceae bacterium]|nr:hypothetical protein [Geopsychrobacteraceae bacterium]